MNQNLINKYQIRLGNKNFVTLKQTKKFMSRKKEFNKDRLFNIFQINPKIIRNGYKRKIQFTNDK